MPKADKKRSELGFRKGDILIATAGRISPEKAQEVLIEAFARIKGEHPKASLLIIGDGPSRRALEGLARERNAEGVRFLGFRTDMDQIMCAIDLFVLPSLTEGLPNVILEAFACKKPVVATAVGGVPEIVDHGKSGLLVPPKRPDLLAEAIQALLRDPERRRAMGEAGYERVRRDFTFEAQAGKLEGIYEEIIDGSLRLRR